MFYYFYHNREPGCEFSTGRRQHLKTHHNTVHLQLRQFKCQDCSYASGRNEDLKKHVDNVHKGIKPFKCDKYVNL